MSFGGNLARGLLQGVSNYTGKLAENQEYDRRAEALQARETAMERVRGERAKDLATHQGGITQANTRAELGIRGQLAAQDDDRARVAQAEKDQREFAIWLKKQPVELRNQLTMEDFRQDRTDQRQSRDQALARESREDTQEHDAATRPTATMENARGEVVQSFGNRTIRTYRDGYPTGTRDDDDDRPRVSGKPGAARPSAAPARPAATPDFTQFDQALAEAAMDPRFKGKSAAQIRAEIIALAKRNGIAAPAR